MSTENTRREKRINPKKELNYLAWFFGALIVIILAVELLAENETAYIRGQGKVVFAFFIIFVYRIFTLSDWGLHYIETIRFLSGKVKFDKDKYVLSSLLNVGLDLFIILFLFFWVKLDKVSFIRVPIAGLVYVLMIGFSALKKRKK
jgi:hypothetical protein